MSLGNTIFDMGIWVKMVRVVGYRFGQFAKDSRSIKPVENQRLNERFRMLQHYILRLFVQKPIISLNDWRETTNGKEIDIPKNPISENRISLPEII